jgi:hypothetical protein
MKSNTSRLGANMITSEIPTHEKKHFCDVIRKFKKTFVPPNRAVVSASCLPSGFYPISDINEDDKTSIVKIFDYHYNIPYTTDNGSSRILDWQRLIERRKGRYHKMSIEDAADIMDDTNLEAQRILSQQLQIPKLEKKDIAKMKDYYCTNTFGWRKKFPFKTKGKKQIPTITGIELPENSDPIFVLGLSPNLNEYEFHDTHMACPFSRQFNVSPIVSWNVMMNMASVVCAMYNSNIAFPIQFILPKQLENLNIDEQIERNEKNYKGFVVLNFNSEDFYAKTNTYQNFRFPRDETLQDSAIVLSVYENNFGNPDEVYSGWTKFSLIHPNGMIVDWGDFSPRKRITYYEIRQVMAHVTSPGSEFFAYEFDGATDTGHRHIFIGKKPDKEIDTLKRVCFDWGNNGTIEINPVGTTLTCKVFDMPKMDVNKLLSWYVDKTDFPQQGGVINPNTIYDDDTVDIVSSFVAKFGEDAVMKVLEIPIDLHASTDIIMKRKGVQNTHILNRSIYRQGKHAGDYISWFKKFANFFDSDTTRLGITSGLNVTCVSFSVAISAACLRKGAKVTHFLPDTMNVSHIVKLKELAKYFELIPLGPFMSGLSVLKPDKTCDVMMIDYLAAWYAPSAALQLINALRIAKLKLRKHGRLWANIYIPNPDSLNNTIYVHAIHILMKHFSTTEVVRYYLGVPGISIVFTDFDDSLPSDDMDIMYEFLCTGNGEVPKLKTSVVDTKKFLKEILTTRKKRVISSLESLNENISINNIQKGGDIERTPPIMYRGLNLVKSFQDFDSANLAQDYIENARDFEPRCHYGQLKLFVSELDFLLSKLKNPNEKAIIVYAGAAPGHHTHILVNMFPNTIWHLYDKRPFHSSLSNLPRVQLFKQYFDEATIVKYNNTSDKLIFISDFRSDDIILDMTNQARWCILLQPFAASLKMRLPYPTETFKTPTPATYGIKFSKKIKKGDFLYLKGVIKNQAFAPMNSTETRLFVTSPFELVAYDIREYESRCYYHNINVRRMIQPELTIPIDYMVLGLDRGWESIYLFGTVLKYTNSPSKAASIIQDVLLTLSPINELTTCTSTTYKKYIAEKYPGHAQNTTLKLWLKITKAREEDMIQIQKRRIHIFKQKGNHTDMITSSKFKF